MATPTKKIVAVPLDAAEIANLVRDEIGLRDKYLEFAQGQIEKDRSYFNHLYKIAAAFLGFMILIASAFSYKSVADMRAEMRASVNDMRAEVKNTTNQELVSARAEVQNRISDEFRGQNINILVANAAKELTGKELKKIILADVSARVESSVKEQRPEIQKVVEEQTKAAVIALQPTISAAVDKATQKQVNDSVTPIQKKMATYGELIQIGTFVTLARSDNRKAFDYLIQVADGDKPESANPDVRNLAQSTTQSIISEKIDGLQTGQSVEENQTPETIKKLIFSTIAIEREASLDNYPQDDNSVLPILVDLIKSDPSITVLYKAVVKFNKITKQSFKFYQEEVILDWWGKNRTSFK